MYVIHRTEEEIDALREKLDDQRDKGGSKFRMTYEEGLEAMLEWLTEEALDDPECDPMT